MTLARIIELALAVGLLGLGIFFYRRRPLDNSSYGNQGAVLLLAVAVIVGIHALGGLDYHPSPAESELMSGGAR